MIKHANKAEIGRLVLLRYLDMHEPSEPIPNYFERIYGINPQECIDSFWQSGLIEYASTEAVLPLCTAKELKEICKAQGLPVSGKKADLIERILTTDIEPPKKCTAVTDKGRQVYAEADIDFEYEHRYEMFYIDNAEELYSKALDKRYGELGNADWYNTHREPIDKAIKQVFKCDRLRRYPKEIKAFMLLCFFQGMDSKTAVIAVEYYLGVYVAFADMHYFSHFIHSYMELADKKEIINMPHSPLIGYKLLFTDERTCPYCKQFEDKIMDIKKAKIGVNYPPFDNCQSEYCRCTVVGVEKEL